MANICENTLRVYSTDPKNLEYIKEFFNNVLNGDVQIMDSENLDIYFNSKWVFPEEEMNKLFDGLPNKKDIDMCCLSVEWGCPYCEFHTCKDSEGWLSDQI